MKKLDASSPQARRIAAGPIRWQSFKRKLARMADKAARAAQAQDATQTEARA
jgi:hypothetical protein